MVWIIVAGMLGACLGFIMATAAAGGVWQKGYSEGYDDGANALADQLRQQIRDANGS